MICRLAIGVAVMLVIASPAFAKHHHQVTTVNPYVQCDDRYPATCGPVQPIRSYAHTRIAYDDSERITNHPAGCPRIAFCGCGVSVKIFGKPIRKLFRAAAWFEFPRASPASGMVAVRKHHVMVILSYDGNGNAVVYDPNSGHHQTRIHTRSLAGYRIVNPSG